MWAFEDMMKVFEQLSIWFVSFSLSCFKSKPISKFHALQLESEIMFLNKYN